MIHYLISLDDLQGFEAMLGSSKNKSRYILRAAINNSAKEVKKRLERDAAKRYAINQGGQAAYRQINKIKKATIGNLAAIVEAKDGPIELFKYKVNDRTYYPGGVGAPKQIKAKALKKSPYKPLANPGYKAFVVKYKSGHISVAERVVPHGLFIIDVQVDPVKVRQLHGQSLFPVALNLFFVPLAVDDFVEANAIEPKQPPQITF